LSRTERRDRTLIIVKHRYMQDAPLLPLVVLVFYLASLATVSGAAAVMCEEKWRQSQAAWESAVENVHGTLSARHDFTPTNNNIVIQLASSLTLAKASKNDTEGAIEHASQVATASVETLQELDESLLHDSTARACQH
jgi:hypothetical protein